MEPEDDERLTWHDLHSMLGVLLVSVMRPLSHAQREEILAEIEQQALDAEKQGDLRAVRFLRALATTAEQAKRWWTQH